MKRSRVFVLVGSLMLGAGIVAGSVVAGSGGDAGLAATQPEDNTAGLPAYSQTAKVTGKVRCAGPASVGLLVDAWVDRFSKVQPGVAVEFKNDGTDAAVPALVAGSADIVSLSRAMTNEEKATFTGKFGHEPTEMVVAIDALAVFVHKANPVESLSFEQLDAMFSASRLRGGAPIANWGGVGQPGEWATEPLALYGYGASAGGYSLFQDVVLKGGGFLGSVQAQPGPGAIVNGVGSTRGGIGYASVAYKTRSVRPVPLNAEAGQAPVAPSYSDCVRGTYPLSRRLYFYVSNKPGEAPPAPVAEFLAFVCSRDGQMVVQDDGIYPITAELSGAQLRAIGR